MPRPVDILLLVLVAATPAVSSHAAGLPAVGDGENLWVIRGSDHAQDIRIYHHHAGDPPGIVRRARDLSNRLAQGGLAAYDGALWVVHEHGTINILTARQTGRERAWTYSLSPSRRLPEGATLRGLAVGPGGAWALVRVESVETLELIDRPAESAMHSAPIDDPMMLQALGLPPDEPLVTPAETDERSDATQPRTPDDQSDQETEGTAKPTAPQATAPEDAAAQDETETAPGNVTRARPETAGRTADQPIAVDRLLRFERGRWAKADLPDDWVSGRPAWLVFRPATSDPILLAGPTDASDGKPRLWRWHDQTWTSTVVDGLSVSKRTEAVMTDGQLVVAQPDDAGREITLRLIRNGETTLLDERVLDHARPGQWAAAPFGDGVAVVYATQPDPDEGAGAVEQGGAPAPDIASLGVTFVAVNLQGRVSIGPTPLTVEQTPTLMNTPNQVVMIGVLVAATIMVLIFWQRDPRQNRLVVPDGYRLAPLLRRAVAGLIDLVPGAVVVFLVFRLTPSAMLSRWPFQPAAETWEAMYPGCVFIGVTVLHTMISELINNRSLGKALMGLSVRSLNGARPSPPQIMTRCLLKSFDLVLQLLLLLPLLRPSRQRLGDLAARTVVIMPKLPEDGSDESAKETDDAE